MVFGAFSRFRRFAVELLRISPVPASIGAKEEPDYVKDARRNPQNYFTCTGCGSGPWHNSWAARHTVPFSGKPDFYMPKKPLGGCCSGAD